MAFIALLTILMLLFCDINCQHVQILVTKNRCDYPKDKGIYPSLDGNNTKYMQCGSTGTFWILPCHHGRVFDMRVRGCILVNQSDIAKSVTAQKLTNQEHVKNIKLAPPGARSETSPWQPPHSPLGVQSVLPHQTIPPGGLGAYQWQKVDTPQTQPKPAPYSWDISPLDPRFQGFYDTRLLSQGPVSSLPESHILAATGSGSNMKGLTAFGAQHTLPGAVGTNPGPYPATIGQNQQSQAPHMPQAWSFGMGHGLNANNIGQGPVSVPGPNFGSGAGFPPPVSGFGQWMNGFAPSETEDEEELEQADSASSRSPNSPPQIIYPPKYPFQHSSQPGARQFLNPASPSQEQGRFPKPFDPRSVENSQNPQFGGSGGRGFPPNSNVPSPIGREERNNFGFPQRPTPFSYLQPPHPQLTPDQEFGFPRFPSGPPPPQGNFGSQWFPHPGPWGPDPRLMGQGEFGPQQPPNQIPEISLPRPVAPIRPVIQPTTPAPTRRPRVTRPPPTSRTTRRPPPPSLPPPPPIPPIPQRPPFPGPGQEEIEEEDTTSFQSQTYFNPYLGMNVNRPDFSHFGRPEQNQFVRPDQNQFVRPDQSQFLRPELNQFVRPDLGQQGGRPPTRIGGGRTPTGNVPRIPNRGAQGGPFVAPQGPSHNREVIPFLGPNHNRNPNNEPDEDSNPYDQGSRLAPVDTRYPVEVQRKCEEGGPCSHDMEANMFCPHPEDHNKYFQCSPSGWMERSCPGSLHFAGDRCDSPGSKASLSVPMGVINKGTFSAPQPHPLLPLFPYPYPPQGGASTGEGGSQGYPYPMPVMQGWAPGNGTGDERQVIYIPVQMPPPGYQMPQGGNNGQQGGDEEEEKKRAVATRV